VSDLRTNKHTCFYFLVSEPVGNFPHKYVNAGVFSSKTFRKFSINPKLICSVREKILLDFIKVLCITIFFQLLMIYLGQMIRRIVGMSGWAIPLTQETRLFGAGGWHS
jgi:hypothetical protein